MALTEAALSSKRARHELRRRTLANGRRTAASSHEVGRIALAAAQSFLEQDPVVELVRFTLWGPGMYGAFAAALEELAS